jgi:uncharacterized membrane protein YkoI
MNKKLIIIPTLLVAIGGGAVLAQTDYFEAAVNNPNISASEAKKIALKQFDGKIVEFDFDSDDRVAHYEIEVAKDNEKVEVTIDAQSGEAVITSRESVKSSTAQTIPTANSSTDVKSDQNQQNVQATISQQQAISIAQTKAAGTVTSVELEVEHDVQVYEIEIQNGKTEYDFKIDATTGAILKYEEDLED